MSQYCEAIPGTPDSETFSTPPSTPGPTSISEASFIQSSRMPNKLASLQIDHKPSDWTPDIELQISPDDTRKANGGPSPAPLSRDYTVVPQGAKPHHLPPPLPSKLLVNSPCFVHSHLDKSAHLTDWLKNKHNAENHDVGVARSLQLPPAPTLAPAAGGLANGYGYEAAFSDDEDENEFHGSITKRLAETAVGVREMSKQLGVYSLCIRPHLNTDALIPLGRPCASAVEHPECTDCHQGPRQQAHQADERACTIFDAEAS